MVKLKNRGEIKRALTEEQPIEEDETENAETGEGEGKGNKENGKNNELTIGDLGSAKELIEEVENKNKGAGEKDTKETEAILERRKLLKLKKFIEDLEKLNSLEDIEEFAEGVEMKRDLSEEEKNILESYKTEVAKGENQSQPEADIIGEYQEVVEQFKNEFGGAFRDIPKDLQDDLSSAHKELQDIEKKIEGLKTEKAKENARENAGQILEELRVKIQEIKDSGNKEIKHGTKAEAKEAATGEKGIEIKKSEFEERMAEEDQGISKAYGGAIYKRFFDEKSFGLTNDIIKESQRALEEQMKDVLVEDARNWLKDREENYPALEGQDIDELDESRIMDLVRNEKDFMEQLDKGNEEWQKIRNLRDSIQKDSPPDIKLALFKRLSEGELKEKLWEKFTGEKLNEKAKEEAGIGEKEIYINDVSRLTEQEDLIEFFVKNELLGTSFEFSYAEWKESLKGFDKKEKEIVINRMRAKEEEQKRKMRTIKENIKKVYPKKMVTEEDKKILALMNGGYDIENIKLKGLFSKKVELQKIDGTKETKEYKEFLEFVDNKVEAYNTDLKKKATEDLSKEWTEKFDAEKSVIVGDEDEKTNEDMIEKCYEKMALNRVAKFLEMGINKDPKRKAKIERKFGKGKRENIKGYISDAIEIGETIDDGSGYDANAESVQNTLESFHIDSEQLTDHQKERFAEYSAKKYGLIDWIFDILFEKIK